MNRKVIKISLIIFIVFSFFSCSSTISQSQRGSDMENKTIRPENLPGLASFTGQMTLRGAGKRTRADIDNYIEFLGGSLSVEIQPDYLSYNLQTLSQHSEKLLELLADIVRRPTFPQDELERLQKKEIGRIELFKSDPEWLGEVEFYKWLYGEKHPYSRYDTNKEAINRMKREYLNWYHSNFYKPNNSVLVVVGDVIPEGFEDIVKRYFEDWQKQDITPVELPPLPVHKEREIIIINRPDSPQATIYAGNLSLKRNDPDYIGLKVVNQVLGANASSRLMLKLREQCGYTYGAYSKFTPTMDKSPLSIWTAVRNDVISGAMREIFKELDRIRNETISADELTKNQTYLTGVFPITMDEINNLSELVAIQRVFDLPDDYWDKYVKNILKINSEDGKAIANKYYDPENLVIVVVGDASKIAEPLTKYGKVKILNQDGVLEKTLDAQPNSWPGGEPPQCPVLGEKAFNNSNVPDFPGTQRNVNFPSVVRFTLDNGLEVNIIQRTNLPITYMKFIVKSGAASDPM